MRIFDIAHRALRMYPKPDALVTKYNGEWEKTSTEQFVNQVNKMSRGLLKLGIKPGDRIGLISTTNRSEWSIVDLGVSQIGVVSVPVYPSISQEDYIYIFNDAEIKYCFVSDKELCRKLLEIKPQVSSLVGIFTFDEVDGVANWDEILDLGEDDSNQLEVEDIANGIQPEDLFTLVYTSGTTGKPKGVMLSHENIISNVLACDHAVPRKKIDYKEIRVLSFLPICHVFERMLYYLFMYNGFSIYFAENTDKLGENMKEIKPHYLTVVPRLIEKIYDKIYATGVKSGGIKSMIFLWALSLLRHYKIGKPTSLKHKIADKLVFSKWREALGGNIIALVSGSATLSTRLNRIFQGAGIPIIEGYGMTETSPVISVNTFEKMKIGTVGSVLSNLDVVIAGDGEITVKGPSVSKGYNNMPELTKEVFTPEGYFKTGDIGFVDDDGFLVITDRKKEMFKTSGGKYIAPQFIESKIKASRFIEEIMVVGDGEKMPCALVQPDFKFLKMWAKRHEVESAETPQEIAKNPQVKARIEKEIEKFNAKLGKWEQIKKIELTPEVWTEKNGLLTPTLKLKRSVIKNRFIDLYNNMYKNNAI